MCGIAGIVGLERDRSALEAMLETIRHRGPDDEGRVWIRAPGGWEVGLGSRRLAILDPTPAGHQPMACGSDRLTYNGEVYNFKELRAELESRGESFRSGTDTEVVLRLLSRGGSRALSRLNGMFALAFWDASAKELLLARDRFGIKPLYYWLTGDGRLLFASELKSLLAAGLDPEIDVEELPAYLSFGYVPGERTLLRGVRRLPPGCLLRWKAGRVSVERFRDVVPDPQPVSDEADAAIELRERLRDAVRRQLVADVPVGILLSGGLDSSALLALATWEVSGPVRAYTVAFRDEDARLEQNPDDAAFARRVASHFGAELREFEVAPDVAELLPRVAWHLDEPLGDPAAILTLIIAEAAAPECTVLLSGMGADELFAGYRVQRFDEWARAAERLPRAARAALAAGTGLLPAVARSGLVRPGLPLAAHRTLRALLDNLSLPREERYAAFRSSPYFQGPLLLEILGPEPRAAAASSTAAFLDAFRRHPHAGFFDRMLHVDLATFLKDQNLLYSDRLSMAASVEMRVPYLDDVVADMALRLPRELKVRGLRGKYLLRRAMDGVVPHEILTRRKAGFGAPIRRWLQQELRDRARELLLGGELVKRGLVQPGVVGRVLEEHAAGSRDHSYRVWSLLGLEIWCRAVLGAGGARGRTAPSGLGDRAVPPAARSAS